jgi:hypothetical protein
MCHVQWCTHTLDGGEHVEALGVGLRGVAVGGNGIGELGRGAGWAACRHSTLMSCRIPIQHSHACHTAC